MYTFFSAVSAVYASLSLRRLVGIPIFFVSPIASLTINLITFPNAIRFHSCFREEHFSGRNSKFRVLQRVVFGTLNYLRILS